MDIESIRHFIEVSKSCNISQTANRINVSQSALSRQLKNLENELGISFFCKDTNNNTILTKDGHFFLEKAYSIIGIIDQTKRDLSKSIDLISGNINIGILPGSLKNSHWMDVLAFLNKHNRVQVNYTIGSIAYLDKQLASNSIDLELSLTTANISNNDTIILKDVFPLGIVIRKDHILANHEIIQIESLLNERLFVSNFGIKELKQHSTYANQLHVISTFDNPIDFLEAVSYFNLVMLCHYPNQKHLDSNNLIFKPLDVNCDAYLCIKRSKQSHSNAVANIFFNHHKKLKENNS